MWYHYLYEWYSFEIVSKHIVNGSEKANLVRLRIWLFSKITIIFIGKYFKRAIKKVFIAV